MTAQQERNGEGCLGRSADAEPVFVLCARDVAAAAAVRDWVERARALETPTTKLFEALAIADAMDVWRRQHGGGKIPD